MANPGEEVWIVMTVTRGQNVFGHECIYPSVEFVASSRESAASYAKSLLEERLYNDSSSLTFAQCSAAMNAFIDGASTAFDEDILNWGDAQTASPYARVLESQKGPSFKLMDKPGGALQIDYALKNGDVKFSLSIKKMSVEK